MFKLKKIGVSMVLSSLMLLAMAIPAFAESVNVELFKEGTNMTEYSMAQDSIKSALIKQAEDGSTHLYITTKWFELAGFYGTMSQMKYSYLGGNEIESNYNSPSVGVEGLIDIKLDPNLSNDLNANSSVDVPNTQVRSDVHLLVGNIGFGYKDVDMRISK